MDKKYNKGELVWAKVRGYPWWPAIIKSIKIRLAKRKESEKDDNTTALVDFIGDTTHASLPISKLRKYSEDYEENIKTKQKTLLNAIKLAENLLKEGKTNNEANTNRIKSLGSVTNKTNFLQPEDKLLSKKRLISKNRIINDDEDEDMPSMPNNININININVNNTNNTVNITADRNNTSNKAPDSSHNSCMDQDSSDSDSEENNTFIIIKEIRKAVNYLLFYNITIPASSCNKTIITSLDLILNKLSEIKNIDLFNVYISSFTIGSLLKI